jgi:ATP-dependent protease HslVU (ClpYQ) peptidase subunit
MTCIAGVVSNGKVVIGGDSAGVGKEELEIRLDPKVFVRDRFIFGFAGSWRIGQLLQYSLEIPPKPESQPIHEYLCTSFVNSARACLKSGGFLGTENGGEESNGGEVLIGTEGELFTMYSSFQIARQQANYAAVGSGAQVARGSLYSTDHEPHISPPVRIKLALQAAERFCSGVRGPFVIESI